MSDGVTFINSPGERVPEEILSGVLLPAREYTSGVKEWRIEAPNCDTKVITYNLNGNGDYQVTYTNDPDMIGFLAQMASLR